jgi:thioredoxin reductase (NADPH)
MADVIVVGGGPAGLTAAIYLARFHLRTLVLDAGGGRARSIPLSRNHAGYPDGIAGTDLVDRMRRQAEMYGAAIRPARATGLERTDDGFVVVAGGRHAAHVVLLATGVTNTRPRMDDALHDAALAAGRLRYCPVCDGFEVTDRRVGVVGTAARGTKEAIFLRGYTADVTLIAPDGAHDLDAGDRATLAVAGIALVDAVDLRFALGDSSIDVATDDGVLRFDSVYPALGSAIHSDLARAAGARTEAVGCIIVDAHQRTSVPGLYAAGDVVLGLDQISHAMGEGGVAATTIRNDLAAGKPLRRAAAGDV